MYNQTLKRKILDYYQNIYSNSLGLPDADQRIKARLDEDNQNSHYSSCKNIELIEKLIHYDFSNKKVLIVGAGTGVEFFRLHKMKADVYALEPDESAIEILKLKAKKDKITTNKIFRCGAEKIPFRNDYFDFVYCYTVIEHVQNVEQSINEMIRVTKKGGYVYINCPDYRFIWEPHYKIYLPLFLPRIFSKFILKLLGRKTGFFNSLQLVNAKKLKNIFRKNKVIALQIIEHESKNKLALFWQRKFEIEPNQSWLIQVK
ncbi:class I SAM-dependent methyltransferase [Patescibacteria group bacterium]|nr:class I SAM-dependent methyltransferase [Patescibacteria group bacterium]